MKSNYIKKDYTRNFYEGITGLIFKKCHLLLEDFNFKKNIDKVLEIGGGYHPHYPYIKSSFNHYFCVELYDKKLNILETRTI